MNLLEHNDLGPIKILLQWEGLGNQIVLVTSTVQSKTKGFYNPITTYKRSKNPHDRYHYCLWGPKHKSIDTLAPIECVTPTGRPQKLGPSLKLFKQMVKSAQTIKLS